MGNMKLKFGTTLHFFTIREDLMTSHKEDISLLQFNKKLFAKSQYK